MITEKQGLETGAIQEFSEALALEHPEQRLVFQELREPPEPDGYCLLDGQPLHIEVGHVYGTKADAKQLLGRTGKSAPTREQQLRAAMVPLDQRLLTPLNELLADKATKTYSSSCVWLLIRSAFPLWSVADFAENKTNIHIPSSHPFDQIWLLCGPRSSFGVLRLA